MSKEKLLELISHIRFKNLLIEDKDLRIKNEIKIDGIANKINKLAEPDPTLYKAQCIAIVNNISALDKEISKKL